MIIRKSAAALIGVSLVTGGALFLVLKNSLIESQLEGLLTKQFNAKSEISGLSLNPIDLQGQISKIEIADQDRPIQNLIQSSKAEADIAGWPIFRGNLVIDTLSIKDLEIGAPRTTSGALTTRVAAKKTANNTGQVTPASEAPTTDIAAEAQTDETNGKQTEDDEINWKSLADNMPKLDLSQASKQLNIPDLTKGLELQSLKQIQQTKQENKQKIDELKTQLDNDDLKKRIAETKQQLATLKTRNITDIKSAEKALKEIESIKKNVAAINRDYKKINNDANQLIRASTLQKSQLSENIRQDINTAKQLANIRNIDTRDIAIILFGPATMQKMQQIMQYADMIKQYIPESEPEDPNERRMGRDILFPVTRGFEPRLLVRNMAFNGRHGSKIFSGSLQNFSSNPLRYQKPVVLSLDSRVNEASWHLGSTLTSVGNNLNNNIQVIGKNIKNQTIKLSKRKDPSNPNRAILTNSDIVADLTVGKNILSGKIKLSADTLDLTFAQKATKKFDREIQNALGKSFRNVVINATLSGSFTKPGLTLNTNIDQRISKRLKAVIGDKIAQANKKLENHVTNSIAKELNIANKDIAAYSKPVKAILSGNAKDSRQLNQLRTQTENDLKAKLSNLKKAHARELKKKAENKLKKSLKGLKL